MTVKLTQICFNFEPFEALSLSFSSKPKSKITSYNYFILQHRESPTITYKKKTKVQEIKKLEEGSIKTSNIKRKVRSKRNKKSRN